MHFPLFGEGVNENKISLKFFEFTYENIICKLTCISALKETPLSCHGLKIFKKFFPQMASDIGIIGQF